MRISSCLPVCFNSQMLPWLVLLVIPPLTVSQNLQLPPAQCASKTVLGTNDSFDVGGFEPMCYVSRVNSTFNLTQSGSGNNTNGSLFSDNSFSLINNEVDKNIVACDLVLLAQCFNGTNMTIANLDILELNHQNMTEEQIQQAALDRQNNNYKIIKGSVYRFRILMRVDLNQVNSNINISAVGNNLTMHTRITMCDALRLGYCNPVQPTEELDATVTPMDTDVGATTIPPSHDRWAYEEGTVLRALRVDDSRVVSRWVRWSMTEEQPGSSVYTTSLEISFTVGDAIDDGAYFFIGSVVMNFDLGLFIEQVDVANAVSRNAVYVQPPPVVKKVSNGMIIYLSVIIGIFGLIELLALVYIIVHRDHPAMKLAQSGFLAALVGMGLCQIVFSFAYMPINDNLCMLSGVLILLPTNIGAAIITSRIWRVYKTLASAMKIGRVNKIENRWDLTEMYLNVLSWLAFFPISVFCKTKANHRKNSVGHRQTVSASETLCLVFILSLPQLVLQVFDIVYYSSNLELQISNTGQFGRLVCQGRASWVLTAGLGLVGLCFLQAVHLAWIARRLPSAFNEKDQIFKVAGFGLIIAFITIALDVITANNFHSPGLSVFLGSSFNIGIAVSTLYLLVWPKIRRVRSGEKVVMTAILDSKSKISVDMDATVGESPVNSALGSPLRVPAAQRVAVSEGDPMPRATEVCIMELENQLRRAIKFCDDGRPLPAEEWTVLLQGCRSLHANLANLDFQWEHTDRALAQEHLVNIIEEVGLG